MVPRKKAIRLFNGLAGSALVSINDAAPASASSGRPRIHTTAAAKQKAFREREAQKKQDEQSKAEVQAIADGKKLPMSAGRFIANAPQGKGKIVSGGYGSKKMEQIESALVRKHLFPTKDVGHGLHDHESSTDANEREDTFTSKIRFPKRWEMTDSEKEEIVSQFVAANSVSQDRSTGEFDPVTKTFPFIPETHTCSLCKKDNRFDFRGELVRHFEETHGRELRKEIRWRQPRCNP